MKKLIILLLTLISFETQAMECRDSDTPTISYVRNRAAKENKHWYWTTAAKNLDVVCIGDKSDELTCFHVPTLENDLADSCD